ncbi:50S ribosomal protein L19e [Candidatus Micrarchaeota archaeon]|jgi:large subunit ribosomal protein L19e|nr:50S ribosomal protein L19e [Candidatus Micrarchaeota archaeon]
MSIKTIRRIASDILNIGENKIKIKPDETTKVKEALTRDDVRSLIKDGIVYKTKKQGVSRAGAKERQKQRKKGRQKGAGKRKGRIKKLPKKQWILRCRIQREILTYLTNSKLIESGDRKNIYYKIKGGFFKNKRSLITYINDNKLSKNTLILEEIITEMKKKRKKIIKTPKQTKEQKKSKKITETKPKVVEKNKK